MQLSFLETLRRELVIGDGAIGTMLQASGLPVGTLPEAWNLARPDAVLAVHRAYLAAGARFVTTNTFGGNRIRLREGGLEADLVEINRLGAAVAKEAAAGRAWVAASVGPTGQLMDPYGPLSIDQAEDLFAEQIEALVAGGADLIKIETQHDVDEACAAVRAAKAVSSLPVICSFAFNLKGRTMMGLKPERAAQEAAAAGADVVGANCGDGPEAVRVALERMGAAVELPLFAQPNAGIPTAGHGAQATWDITPQELAEAISGYVELGARVVSGCCGTSPDYVAAMVTRLAQE